MFINALKPTYEYYSTVDSKFENLEIQALQDIVLYSKSSMSDLRQKESRIPTSAVSRLDYLSSVIMLASQHAM
jgi:hypothetical protein